MAEPAPDYGVLRVRMVREQIVGRGLHDEAVVAAMRSVPRHLFVPASVAPEAYQDSPLPIGHGQTISQPYMVGLMTELLGADVRSRVLEIGAGSGYQTAVLAETVDEVYAIERIAPLAEHAQEVLDMLGYSNVHLKLGDGTLGWPDEAPFDGILVAAATSEAPPTLLQQLADGGRLVVPVGRPHHDQVLTIIERHGASFMQRHDTRCRFVPLISDAPAGHVVAAAKAVDVRVQGIVQGVFYRRSAQVEATRRGLRGWVRNLGDGSVALRLQGRPAEVEGMLGWCREGPPGAQVSQLVVADVELDETLTAFEVR